MKFMLLFHRLHLRQTYISFKNFHNSNALCKIVPFNLSDIGEGIREVVIKEWYIKENDTIKQFDPVCEVQSDKASVTISSRYDGIVKKLHSNVDEVVKVGNPLIDIELDDEADDNMEKQTQDLKNSFKDEKEKLYSNSKQQHNDDKHGMSVISNENIKMIPMVRKLAKDLCIKPENLSGLGSGKGGRITEADVYQYKARSENGLISKHVPDRIEKIKGARKAMITSMNKTLAIPQFMLTELIEATALLEFKERANRFLQDQKNNQRKINEVNSHNFESPVKITLMPLLIKTASIALHSFPILNSRFNEATESLQYQASHNIGIAIDTQTSDLGLVVPNIKGVQDLSLIKIAKVLERLVRDCKTSQKPQMNDLKDGTFTLSNIGMIGGLHSKPILLPPEVAIVSIGRISPQLFYKKHQDSAHLLTNQINSIPNSPSHWPNPNVLQINSHSVNEMFNKRNNFKIAPGIFVSMSADHRVIDGATVARFLALWKNLLENPAESLILS